nr:hypothetical protein [Marinicella sp. W31]MDC2876188.1 hypothetical protein [Marinicella sp. W31]
MTSADETSAAGPAPRRSAIPAWLVSRLEAMAIPVFALLAGSLLFSLFLLTQGQSPAEFFALVWKAGFSSAFSWKNTLSRVSPLLMAALCVAIPARLGLMIIGGEGQSCSAVSPLRSPVWPVPVCRRCLALRP